MEHPSPQQPPEQPPTITARLARLLTQFTEQQKPTTQAAIARALGVVNSWLSRLQKEKVARVQARTGLIDQAGLSSNALQAIFLSAASTTPDRPRPTRTLRDHKNVRALPSVAQRPAQPVRPWPSSTVSTLILVVTGRLASCVEQGSGGVTMDDDELGARHMAEADQRIADAEARLLRMGELLAEMERDRHPAAVERARELIATFEQMLQAMHTSRALCAAMHPPRSPAA
jgi:hypothetical protein